MADSANSLSGSVGLDTTAFKTGVAQLTQSIRDIETNFRASAAVMGDWSSTSDGLKERVSSLGDKLDLQKQKLSTLREQFIALQNAEGDNSKAMASIASQMSTVERAISSTQSQINKYSSALKESESPAAGLQEKLSGLSQQIQLSASKFSVTAAAMGDWASKSDGLRAKLDSLREIESSQKQQVSELESVYSQIIQKEGENSSAATSMAIKLNEARAAFEKTGSDIRTFSSDLSATEAKEKEQSSALGKLKTAFQELGDKAKSSGSGMSSMLSGLKGSIAGFAAGMVGSLSFGTIIDATDKAEKTTAQMEAVLKSTGGAAGMTANQLNGLATSQAKVTTFSAGTTKQAENMLLTFTNIKSNVFPQTIKASEDMATAMGMNATDAAKTLGKALNDPATGLSKLTKQGVTFTDAQKQQIDAMVKSGNTAGAQTLMLQELEKEFGGSAKAAGSTLTGQVQIMENNLKGAGVQIATSLMPIAQTVLPMIVQGAQTLAAAITAHKAEIQGAVKEVTTVIKDVFGFITTHGPLIKGLIIGIGGAFVAFKAVSGIIAGITTAIKIWQGVTKAFTVVQAALNLVMSANPIALIIIGIVALVAALVILFNKCKPFHDFVINSIAVIKTAFLAAVDTIKAVFGAIVGFFQNVWNGIVAVFSVVAGWFEGVFGAAWAGIRAIWGVVTGFFSGVWNGIVAVFSVVVAYYLSQFSMAWNAVQAVWSVAVGFFSAVWGGITAVFSGVAGWFSGVFSGAVNAIRGAWGGVVGFFSGIRSGIAGAFFGIGDHIKDAFMSGLDFIKNLPGQALQWGKDIINGIVNGIKSAAGAVGNAVQGVAQDIRNFLHFSKPDVGPLADFDTYMPDMMQTMADGITGNVGKLKSAASKAASALSGGLQANVVPAVAGGYGQSSTSTSYSSNPQFYITISAPGADVSKQQDMHKMAGVLGTEILKMANRKGMVMPT